MPNHITTIITGPQQALSSLLDDIGRVDFEYLIPLPENYEQGGCTGQHAPGVVCWYSWNIENWGTKWNAYDSEVTEGRVKFETAWSHPWPVMQALSLKHPDVEFEVKYADEDLGSNLGHYRMKNGEQTGEAFEPQSPEALEFASQLLYGKPYAELRAEWDAEEVEV